MKIKSRERVVHEDDLILKLFVQLLFYKIIESF